MLDQQVVNLANERIRLKIAEQNKRIREDIVRVESEMAIKGLSRSGATIERIASLCSEAIKDRAQMAWQTLFRVLTMSGVQYQEGFPEELKRLVAEHLPETLDDLKGMQKQEATKLGLVNLIPHVQEEIEAPRIAALTEINGEIDLFVLSLNKSENVPIVHPEVYVDSARIKELHTIKTDKFDLTKLIELCKELNKSYSNGSYLAVAMFVLAILDHVSPIFGCRSFADVTSKYSGGSRSFKQSMEHLDKSLRKIADAHLHPQIRKKEILPNKTQVNFSNDLDVLLSEIVRILK